MASNPSRSRNKCGRSIFRDLLVEEYKKKPKNINVVEKKRQKFQLNLFKAHSELKSKKFAVAKKSYADIIIYLKKEPYLDELQLCADIYYCINCCFCYCCVMDALARKDKKFYDMAEKLIRELSEKESDKLFPKFLQVLFHFERKDWAMTLQWCKAVETHEDDFEKQCVQIDITRTVLPSGTTLIDESRLYEEKAFFNHWEDMVKIRLAESPNKKYKFLLKEINILMKLIKLDTSFPTSELQNIFNEDVVPLWQGSKEIDPEKDSYQCSDCMLKEMFDISILDNKQAEEAAVRVNRHLKNFLSFFIKLLQAGFIVNLEPSIIDKLQEFRYLVTKEMNLNLIEDETGITGEIKLPSETLPKCYTTQTQTDKIKCGNKCIQTEGIKYKNAEVQVNCDMQVLTTLQDIKNKLLVSQEKKDDTIVKLNRKISELNDKLAKETNKKKSIEEEYKKKINKQECEIKKLNEKLEELAKTRNQEREQNIYLQKLFVEQFTDRYNKQKNVYKIFESKASFIVGYLKEISHFLTATSIPSNSAVQQNITIWEDYLNNFKENLDRLNNFYKKVRADMISTGKFTMTWPDIPEFPKDEDNIIFASFKPAIKNIIEIEEKLLKNFKPTVQSSVQPSPQVTQTIPYAVSTPHFPVQRSSYFIGSGLYYPTIPPPITIQPNNITQLHPQLVRERVAFENLMQQPIPVEPRMRQNLQMSKSTECLSKPAEKMKEDKSKGTLSEATASNTKEPIDKKYQEKEKILFEYVIEKCPGSSEEDVTFALLHVVDENKGSLAKLSKEKVVEEVKMALRMKKQSAWVTPKSPHVQWHNDHSERNCSICFEDFSVKEMFTLQCQHEYHKECIKKWLKTSSVCPICRVHSVIDEDFPPLH